MRSEPLSIFAMTQSSFLMWTVRKSGYRYALYTPHHEECFCLSGSDLASSYLFLLLLAPLRTYFYFSFLVSRFSFSLLLLDVAPSDMISAFILITLRLCHCTEYYRHIFLPSALLVFSLFCVFSLCTILSYFVPYCMHTHIVRIHTFIYSFLSIPRSVAAYSSHNIMCLYSRVRICYVSMLVMLGSRHVIVCVNTGVAFHVCNHDYGKSTPSIFHLPNQQWTFSTAFPP